MSDSAEKQYLLYQEYLEKNDKHNAGLSLMVSALMGYLPAQKELGYKYLNGILFPKDYSYAMRWLNEAADQGDMDSVINLATMYMYGYGTKTNGPKAMELLQKAVEAEHPAAGRFLGSCYEKGIGTEKNAEKAVEWYLWSAERGDAGAAYLLGDAYENGNGVTADRDKAVEWYEKAAAQEGEEAEMAKTALAKLKGNN